MTKSSNTYPRAYSPLASALLTISVLHAGAANASVFQYRHVVQGLVASASPAVPVTPVSPETPPPPVVEESLAQLSLAGSIPSLVANQAYSFSLVPLLTVTGDLSYDSAQVTWSASGLPAGIQLTGSALSGTVTVGGSHTVTVTASYKGKTASQTYSMVVASYHTSCLAYLTANPGASSGNYTLDVDGSGPEAAQSYYCDMTSEGGGWTKVVQQYESTPVTNWNGGVSGSSFALASAKIPAHTQVGFGKDNAATFIDYVTWTYTTGNVYPAVSVTSPKTAKRYQVYRSASGWFYNHDPEQGWYTTWDAQVDARSALSLDEVGKQTGNWSFSPRYGSSYVNSRGYAMNGYTNGQANAYAWTVWVR